MHYLGVTYDMKHIPELDPGFIPFGVWADAYRKGAEKPWPSPWSGTRAT